MKELEVLHKVCGIEAVGVWPGEWKIEGSAAMFNIWNMLKNEKILICSLLLQDWN